MSYDLPLGRDHDLTFGGQRDGLERVRQQIEVTLLTLLGEWFLDINWGLPVFQKILIKSPRRAEIETIVRAKVLDVPGVVAVPTVRVEINPQTRAGQITMPDIMTEYGATTVEVRHG